MIVKDQEKLINEAAKLGAKLHEIMLVELPNKLDKDSEPADFIYYLCHCAGSCMATFHRVLKGYCELYGMGDATDEVIRGWIEATTNDWLKIQEDKK